MKSILVGLGVELGEVAERKHIILTAEDVSIRIEFPCELTDRQTDVLISLMSDLDELVAKILDTLAAEMGTDE